MYIRKPMPFILNIKKYKKYKKEVIEAYCNFFNKADGKIAGYIMYIVQIDCDSPSFEVASCPLLINETERCLEVIQTIMIKANFVKWI